MSKKNRYTFLGAGDAALSMFIEIIASVDSKNFAIQIVNNIDIESIHSYLIPGIKSTVTFHNDWLRSPLEKLVIGVNKSESKRIVYQFFKKHYNIQYKDYTSLIHANTSIASTVELNSGVIMNPGVILAPFVRIGNLTTVNRNVSVGHHTIISDLCTIHPGVNIAGHCEISSSVTIGIGSNIIEGITIGENSIIGAGSLVTKDIPSGVVAFGFPTKVIRSLT